MKYEITAERIRTSLQKRLDEETAELEALKNVSINTDHKTLTNRAITGDGARIGDYLGINKALFVSYIVAYSDGSKRYASRDITAYSYYDEAGKEIGANGCIRISRTITPAELADILRDVIESKAEFIGTLQSEFKRAETIAKKHNALVKQINEFNDSVSYASEAQL
jgi:hypothetical protein